MKKTLILVVFTLFVFSFSGISTAIAQECAAGSPGYWKNHPEAWNVLTINVGGIDYTVQQAIKIMKKPVKGDKSLTLFKSAVAATLNIGTGNCPPPPPPPDCAPLMQCWPGGTCEPLAQANLWLSAYGVGTGIAANTEMWQESHGEDTYLCLDAYNNGLLPGIPSRD